MTEEELKKVPFRWQGHMRLESEHTSTYLSEDKRIGFCDHVPFRNGAPHGKGHRHWMLDGKVYKTKEKFIEALKEFGL